MRRQSSNSQPPQLNLAPIMNMVVILIPLLLLSVVFLSVGVINVSAPTGTLDGTPTDEPEPLKLAVRITHEGFVVSTRDGVIRSVDGCSVDGPTVCLTKTADTQELFAEAGTDRQLERVAAHYDWARLYTQLREIKQANQAETTVRITAEPDIPYMMVVRTMDLARWELDGKVGQGTVWSARQSKTMFPDPILAVSGR